MSTMPMKSRWSWLAVSGMALAVVGCGSSPTAGDRRIATGDIGQAGGRLVSTSGQVEVTIPPGAVTSNVAFTIQQVDSPRAGAVGQVFELGPSGMTFHQPVTLTFHYLSADLGDNPPQALRVATLDRHGWQPVPSVVDVRTGAVSGEATHFSPWTLVLFADPPDHDGAAGGGGDAGGDGSQADGAATADAGRGAPDAAAPDTGQAADGAAAGAALDGGAQADAAADTAAADAAAAADACADTAAP
jgi:hypothetical protein